jgi:hypothetical protein|tara:strand:- start:890 stop:1150 length:261 start_codon:yes stop_codon:yes gene_type:complete
MKNILDRAIDKIDRETLDNIGRGNTIVLNERYELYSYWDMDYYVIIDTLIDAEIFCVQYADYYDKNNKHLVITDFYGYEEIEETLT